MAPAACFVEGEMDKEAAGGREERKTEILVGILIGSLIFV
jgi:hypothetical protein